MRTLCYSMLAVSLSLLKVHFAAGQLPPPAPVVVAVVVAQESMQGQPFVATVEPSRRATVGSAVGGRVAEYLVNEGDRVEEGQALAQLLTESVSSEIAVAMADLELREQELAELENGTRPEEIARDRARMLAAKATRDYQASRRQRVERLFAQGATVSEEQRDEAIAAAETAAQEFEHAASEFELSRAGPRIERIQQARARVAGQRATVDKLNDQLRKHTIVSRFAGFVTAEHTEEGAWVNQGDPVAEVAALDEVEVQAFVVEQSIRHVQIGMQVRVEIGALPHDTFLGQVVLVVPQADLRARTFPVKIRVVNRVHDRQPLIKAGMSARVVLPTGNRIVGTLVPKDALVLGGSQPMVYVIAAGADNGTPATARAVPVELGAAVGDWMQVQGPIEPGNQVVVEGNERLRPDQQVVVQKVLETKPPDQAAAAQDVKASNANAESGAPAVSPLQTTISS